MFGLTEFNTSVQYHVRAEPEIKVPEEGFSNLSPIAPKAKLDGQIQINQTNPILRNFDEIFGSMDQEEALVKFTEFNLHLRLFPPAQDLVGELKLRRKQIGKGNFHSAFQYQLTLLDETLFGRPKAEIINKTEELTSAVRHDYSLENRGLTPQKKLAIEVSELVDGNDFRPIRMNIHQNPGPDNLLLVQRYIDDFESGRRRFVFQSCENTTLDCYQMMMLYVIDSFSQRHQYYQLHPDYLPKEEYQNFSANFVEKSIYSGMDARFAFEYYACQLEKMRNQVLSITPENIDSVLEDFRKLYYRVQDITQNITVSTGITSNVFSRNSRMKPVPIFGAPNSLKKLGEIIYMPISKMGKVLNSRVDQLLEFLKEPVPQVSRGLAQIDENLKLIEKGGLSFQQEKELRLACVKILDSLEPFLSGQIERSSIVMYLTSGLGLTKHDLYSVRRYLTEEVYEELSKEYPFLESMSQFILALPKNELCEDRIIPMLLQGLETIDQISKKNPRLFLKLRECLIGTLSSTPHRIKGSWAGVKRLHFFIKKLDDTQLAEYPNIQKQINELKIILEAIIGNYCDTKAEVVRNPTTVLNLIMRLQNCSEQLEQELKTVNPQNLNSDSILTQFDGVKQTITDLCIPFVGPNSFQKILKEDDLEFLNDRLARLKKYADSHVKQVPQELASLLSNLRNVVNQEEYFDARYGETVKGTSVDPVKQCMAVLETTAKLRPALLTYQSRNEEIHHFLQFLLSLEISTSNRLVSELKNEKFNQEALEKLIMTGQSQNLMTAAQGRALLHPESQLEALAEIRDQLLNGYAGINGRLLNDDAWHQALGQQQNTPSSFLQFQTGLLNGTVLGAIDRVINAHRVQSTEQGILGGIPTKTGTVTGRLVIVRDTDHFPEVSRGDILVMHELPAAHKGYLKAAGVISESGGVLSHGAVMLKELSVPCLVGATAARETLQNLDGKWVKVTIAKKGQQVEEISEEQAQVVFKEDGPFDLSACLNRAFKAKSAIEKRHLHQILSGVGHQKDEQLQKLIGQALAATKGGELKPYVWKGKAQTLQDLRELKLPGFRVPESPILKAEQIFALSGWRQEIQEKLNEGDFNKINEIIMQRPLSAPLIQAFEEIWKALKGDDPSQEMIVRSSSGLEDTGTHRMAGLFESVGHLKTFEEGLQAFRTVLASAFSERALNFCSDRSKLFSMDIFVQKYVSQGTHSGVAFSVSDINNWDNAALQVTEGLGGGVDGTGNPTMLTVDASVNKIIDQQSHELMCVPPSIAKKIAQAVKEIETAFEQPVEVEFVYDKETDEITIVQVAPITSL